jgi:hypothetical protein
MFKQLAEFFGVSKKAALSLPVGEGEIDEHTLRLFEETITDTDIKNFQDHVATSPWTYYFENEGKGENHTETRLELTWSDDKFRTDALRNINDNCPSITRIDKSNSTFQFFKQLVLPGPGEDPDIDLGILSTATNRTADAVGLACIEKKVLDAAQGSELYFALGALGVMGGLAFLAAIVFICCPKKSSQTVSQEPIHPSTEDDLEYQSSPTSSRQWRPLN